MDAAEFNTALQLTLLAWKVIITNAQVVVEEG